MTAPYTHTWKVVPVRATVVDAWHMRYNQPGRFVNETSSGRPPTTELRCSKCEQYSNDVGYDLTGHPLPCTRDLSIPASGIALGHLAHLVGLRNRLRCPSCDSVGTYKPHGGMFDRGDKRGVPRWLCKWCGYYRAHDGNGRICVIDTERKVWAFRIECPNGLTPLEAATQAMGVKPNPWLG